MKVSFGPEDEVQPSQFLNEGKWTCTITKIDNTPSKKGDAMLTIEFTAPTGKTTRDWFLLTAGQKFKLLHLVKAAGLNPTTFDTDQLLRRQVTVERTKTGTREYNGKAVDNFENSYSAPAGTPAQTDEIPF